MQRKAAIGEQNPEFRSQKPEYMVENRINRFSFILAPDFWLLDSAFLNCELRGL
jgi:hypothetical protein